MSFRTRRILIMTPFYMIFQFFLLKYLLLLFGGLDDGYLIIIAIIVGLLHCMPMFFESKKSTVAGRFLTTIGGVWMWMSLMFLFDLMFIYLIKMFVILPFEIIVDLVLIVPFLGIYNFYKSHKLVINEKILELNNLSRDINIVHLSDVHFGSVRHKKIIIYWSIS